MVAEEETQLIQLKKLNMIESIDRWIEEIKKKIYNEKEINNDHDLVKINKDRHRHLDAAAAVYRPIFKPISDKTT